jgi:hypothetical protein
MRGHRYTKEQDDFIRDNYSNAAECVRAFNKRFGTTLSYEALTSHANRTLGVVTGFRPWTAERNADLQDILRKFSYKEATRFFNEKHGTSFTVKQIQSHCIHLGIKRGFYDSIKRVDQIIADNIDKPYEEIMKIVNSQTPHNYTTRVSIGRRANNLGLSRPHRAWDHKNDKRKVNGKEVDHNIHVRFVTNKFHRLSKELQPLALSVVQLQAEIAKKETKG